MKQKRRIGFFSAALIILVSLLSGCRDAVSRADYNHMTAERDSARAEVSSIQKSYEDVLATLNKANEELTQLKDIYRLLHTEYEQVNSQYEQLTDEYIQLEETVAPYLMLSEAQAAAKAAKMELEKAQTEKKLAKLKAAEEAEQQRLREEEQAKRTEEEKKEYQTGITYDDLAQAPKEYRGEKVKFTGTVLQVIEGGETTQIRLAEDGDLSTILFCEYSSSITLSRVLKEDTITIYGVSNGLLTYESSEGIKITIPAVKVDHIDQ